MVQACVVVLLLGCCLAESVGEKIECVAYPDRPKDDPNNYYKCNKPETCCQEGGRPSCCTTRATEDSVWLQVQLWGIVAVLVLALALLMCYCRHDGDCFGNKKDGEGSCCCGKRQSEDNLEEVKMADNDGEEGKMEDVEAGDGREADKAK